MSLRVMRKLLAKQEVPQSSSPEEGDQEEDDETQEVPTRNNFGVLWSELVQEGELDEDDEPAEEAGVGDSSLENPGSGSAGIVAGQSRKSKNKKKRSKKKGKGGVAVDSVCLGAQLAGVDLEPGRSGSSTHVGDDAGEGPAPAKASNCQEGVPKASSELLQADPGLLRAEDELKRIFGAKVMKDVDRQEAASRQGAAYGAVVPAVRGGIRQAGSRRPGRVSAGRKFILVQPLESWPPVQKGELMMEQVSRDLPSSKPKRAASSKKTSADSEGVAWFRYIQSPAYERVSKLLQECVETHDPNSLVDLVAHNPFHVEGLLALADVSRHVGEAQASAELLERALYVLESAWHPYFNPTQGNCRLDFAWPANQPLFLALFRNIQQLSRRGCHRAAFECSKILLSLNPDDDPHGMLLCIDYFALRANQVQWLEDFVERRVDRSLSVMPNYSFSLALAQLHREEEEGSGSLDHATSKDLLRDALLLHPYVFPLIIKKAPIQVNAEWSKLLKAKPFCGPHNTTPSLEHLASLYAERSSLLWQPPSVQKWLKEVAAAVVQGLGRGGALQGDYDNWTCVRQEAFTDTTNEYRHLLIADFSDTVSTVPPEVLLGGGGEPQQPPVGDVQPEPRGIPADELAARNALMLFLETLLPWNDYGVPPEHQQQRPQAPDDPR